MRATRKLCTNMHSIFHQQYNEWNPRNESTNPRKWCDSKLFEPKRNIRIRPKIHLQFKLENNNYLSFPSLSIQEVICTLRKPLSLFDQCCSHHLLGWCLHGFHYLFCPYLHHKSIILYIINHTIPFSSSDVSRTPGGHQELKTRLINVLILSFISCIQEPNNVWHVFRNLASVYALESPILDKA